MPNLILTKDQREKLKEPLGELIEGSSVECNRVLKETIGAERPSLLLLVGDTVSRNAVQAGIKPDVVVVDEKEMRAEATPFAYSSQHVFRTKNAAGTIDLIAWEAVEEATRRRNSIVQVDGEEDLLTLVAISVAPLGSLVVYGQPNEGIVLVRVSREKKREVDGIIQGMEKRD